jgi:hypothetical protein
MSATEAQAEAAIIILKRMIDAAENGNQAGEAAVLAAACGIDLLEAADELTLVLGLTAIKYAGQMEVLQKSHDKMRAVIARAAGRS